MPNNYYRETCCKLSVSTEYLLVDRYVYFRGQLLLARKKPRDNLYHANPIILCLPAGGGRLPLIRPPCILDSTVVSDDVIIALMHPRSCL